jgi:hypothetical protein
MIFLAQKLLLAISYSIREHRTKITAFQVAKNLQISSPLVSKSQVYGVQSVGAMGGNSTS